MDAQSMYSIQRANTPYLQLPCQKASEKISHMTDSTAHTAPPKSTKSQKSDSSVQILQLGSNQVFYRINFLI